MKFGADGRLYAINPEAGFFGVAPGHRRRRPTPTPCSPSTATASSPTPRCTDDGDVWWEGMTDEPPAHLDRLAAATTGRRTSETPAAHPNARFTAPASPVPVDRARVGGPGRRADLAILFGGRRATVVPLVTEAFDWEHGVFLGSIMASETTAAAAGAVGKLRRDPFAMLPFCGYNMADYFAHWLAIGEPPTARSCPRSSTSTGSARTTDGRSCGRASARTAACSTWVFEPLRRRRRGRRHSDRPGAGARRARHRRARRLRRRPDAAARGRRGGLAGRAAARSRSTTPSSATGCRRRCATSWPRSRSASIAPEAAGAQRVARVNLRRSSRRAWGCRSGRTARSRTPSRAQRGRRGPAS